jgi:hypothetical protein
MSPADPNSSTAPTPSTLSSDPPENL